MATHPQNRSQLPTKTRVRRRMRRQHDVATRAQLAEEGLSASSTDRMVAAGELKVVYRGVYRDGAFPLSPFGRLLAACLATAGIASHRAAAWLWGLVERPFIEITVARDRSTPLGDTCVVHRTKDMPARSVRKGIPCTNPLRTMIDLAAVLEGDELWLAFARGVSSRLLTPDSVRAENDRLRAPGRRGAVAIDRILGELGPVSLESPSVLQLAFARLVVRMRLEWPEPEVPVLGGRFRIDFAYVDVMLAIELLGFDAHNDPLKASEAAARRRALLALGWTVLEFTWDEVWNHPERVVAEILDHLARLRAA